VIRIADRRHPNVAAVALANKTTRIAWAMLSRERITSQQFYKRRTTLHDC